MSMNATEEMLAGNADPDATSFEYKLWWYWCWFMYQNYVFVPYLAKISDITCSMSYDYYINCGCIVMFYKQAASSRILIVKVANGVPQHFFNEPKYSNILSMLKIKQFSKVDNKQIMVLPLFR